MAKTQTKAKDKPKKKAMTGAERQARYRERAKRHVWGEGGRVPLVELKAWIDGAVFLALEEQAKHYGVTKREMLERVILRGSVAMDQEMSRKSGKS